MKNKMKCYITKTGKYYEEPIKNGVVLIPISPNNPVLIDLIEISSLAKLIWDSIGDKGNKTVEDIIAFVCSMFPQVENVQIHDDICAFLNGLHEKEAINFI